MLLQLCLTMLKNIGKFERSSKNWLSLRLTISENDLSAQKYCTATLIVSTLFYTFILVFISIPTRELIFTDASVLFMVSFTVQSTFEKRGVRKSSEEQRLYLENYRSCLVYYMAAYFIQKHHKERCTGDTIAKNLKLFKCFFKYSIEANQPV